MISLASMMVAATLFAADVPGGLEPRPEIRDPARVTDDGWMAFDVPALPGTRSPCCWQGRWNEPRRIGCDLDGTQHSYGSSDDSPETDRLTVFARRQSGQVDRLQVIGTACPVDTAGHVVTWMPNVTTDHGLEWLDAQSRSTPRGVADQALFALARHADDEAGDRLLGMARESASEHSGQAVFWLGEARGEQGLAALETLLDELPPGPRRIRINFALSQNDSPGAGERLLALSRDDPNPEQRADALFWLSESHHPGALERLSDALRNDPSRQVRERAVFALAQLETPEAGDALVKLVRTAADPKLRGEAVFWLSQSHPGRAEPVIMALLAEPQPRGFGERLVFALSQLPPERANPRLMALARDPGQSRSIRRQALFWLAQSDDDEAVDDLVRLLTGEP